MLTRAQPYYDFEIARICAWLKANGFTMHVKLSGSVELRRSQSDDASKKGEG